MDINGYKYIFGDGKYCISTGCIGEKKHPAICIVNLVGSNKKYKPSENIPRELFKKSVEQNYSTLLIFNENSIPVIDGLINKLNKIKSVIKERNVDKSEVTTCESTNIQSK